jgi:SAM-dependent methyltransferase
VNFFAPKSVAKRFAKGRPNWHPAIIGRVKEVLSPAGSLSRAIDVGCGTGLSTTALKQLATSVIGVDASVEMLSLAPTHPEIKYCVASAEALPFRSEAFDLITASNAILWFDHTRFFSEAERVLRRGGWLVVYDNYFTAETTSFPEFQRWHEQSYLKKYPSPPLDEPLFADMQGKGLALVNHESHENVVAFSMEALVNYMMSQSNTIAAAEAGRETITEIRHWLETELRPIFGDVNEGDFRFQALIWYLQRAT